jgi:sterol desaturase/sphingolipid hydroxylase (fatty acid hydroxylase superfamily)
VAPMSQPNVAASCCRTSMHARLVAIAVLAATLPEASAFQRAPLSTVAGARLPRAMPLLPRCLKTARRRKLRQPAAAMSMPTLFGQELTYGFMLGAYTVSIGTAFFLVVLERLLWDDAWKEQFAQPHTSAMYWSGLRANLLNYLLLAPAAKGIATAWVMSQAAYLHPCIAFPGTLLCQAVGYALAHNWMHRPENYRWTGHRYHHQFHNKSFLRPISANAVTWVEFLIAYAIPLMAGIVLFRPSPVVTNAVILTVSFANLCIHTPETLLPMNWAPSFMVSNRKHFYHHNVDGTKFLSAPIADLDKVLGLRTKGNVP